MSRLVSMFMLWLLLLLAAAPASAVMDVQPKNGTWELPASSYDLAPDVRDGPNLYAYVKQNPWTKFDPLGLWEDDGDGDLYTGFSARGARAVEGKLNQVGSAVESSVVTAAKVAPRMAAEAGASMIPGVGEVQDMSVIADPKSSRGEKLAATISLGLNGLTEGGLPNAGAFIRGKRAATLSDNVVNGARREAEVAAELVKENPSKLVQGQRTLVDANGKKVVDPITGEGRRVDHAVIDPGTNTAKTFETTGPAVDKRLQLQKEQRIREQGGTFVKDKTTKQPVPVEDVSEVRRKP